MGGKTITLIGSSPAALANPAIEAALARWPESDRPATASLTFEQVLEHEAFLDRCGVAWVILDEAQAPGLYSLLAMLQDRHLPSMLSRPEEKHPLGAAFQEGVVIAPLDADSEPVAAILRTLWCQAGVVRSLRVEIAALQAHQGGLCDQIGKIDEELRLAAQLQREFLPAKLPEIGPVEFHVFFRPASYVSGDIYDVIQLDEHHVGFFIADAVGHGVPAALMTMYIKRCLHTKAVDATLPRGYRIVPPDEALAQLNHDMVQQQATGKVRFATACYGVINCKTLELSFARAGHPFPLVLHADDTTELLSPDGGMLGIFPEEKFELMHTRLRPGDRLLLYSDGFEVAFPTREQQGGKRVLATQQYAEEFKQLAHGSLDTAIEQLITKLDQQLGSLHQRDDLTVVCLGVGYEDAAVARKESRQVQVAAV
jgi:phosphoserine phosphatase RsbU/P